MASSFVGALRTHGFERFRIFGSTQPAPVASGISRKVAVVVAAVAALWLGVAVAIVHSRYRRPVLSVARAVALTGADRVVELGGRRSRWLGVLASRRGKEAANLPDGAALDAPRAAVATIAGRAPRTATVASVPSAPPAIAEVPGVVACDPGTPESELLRVVELRRATGTTEPLVLLWAA